MGETYSVQTFVMDQGKKVRGTLALYPDRYEFNDEQRKVNWEKTTCERGTSTVRTFFFRSERPHVIIREEENAGPIFILTQEQANAIEEKIGELRELVRNRRLQREEEQRRLEEEERRRQEEEAERLRLEAEERRRQEEEARKRREEEERRKREEAERKRRLEEEARKRREEEERLRKLEEERRAREALARKTEARNNRIQKAVEEARGTARAVSVSGRDARLSRAWSCITENPYRILGVPVTATTSEANAAFEKIKKLIRLKAPGSYRPRYELNGLEKPERDLSITQNALTTVKEMRHKWFWFASEDACAAWQSGDFRRELTSDGIHYGTYDLFLANYAYALIYDHEFRYPSVWKPVFSFYIYLCDEPSHAVLKTRFNSRELEGLRMEDAAADFRAEILKPIEDLCDTEDVMAIQRLYLILKEQNSPATNPLKQTVAMKMTKWFKDREDRTLKALAKYDSRDTLLEFELREADQVGQSYVKEIGEAIEDVLEAVKGEPVRRDMIRESYRNTTWQLMYLMNKVSQKGRAIFYANKTYPYCKEDDQRRIINTFGMQNLKAAIQDAPLAEWDVLGDNYFEGKNGYDQDYNCAFTWYKRAAEAGNKYSQNSLGICYRDGKGTSKSAYNAACWFEKAWKNGNADGAFNLAQCYATGEGRLQDRMKAVDLYAEAAKLGHPYAAEVGKRLLDLVVMEKKLHRLTQHNHYDLGYQMPIGQTIIVEVTLNYSANVYLLEGDDYKKYLELDNFSYYGGRATQSPYRLKIPSSGFWHLVIDNGDDDMTGIRASVGTRTFNF